MTPPPNLPEAIHSVADPLTTSEWITPPQWWRSKTPLAAVEGLDKSLELLQATRQSSKQVKLTLRREHHDGFGVSLSRLSTWTAPNPSQRMRSVHVDA